LQAPIVRVTVSDSLLITTYSYKETSEAVVGQV